jgi:parvulin-like peptidyl-prolyl isomerase
MKHVIGTEHKSHNRRAILGAGFVVLAIGIVTTVLIYENTRAPFRATVLEVNDTSIKMKYFLKRLSLARTSSSAMLQTLANEQIIKQVAPQPPYNIRISDSEVERALDEAARRQGAVVGERALNIWYREQLEQTGFSDAEYRDLVRTNLLTRRLIEYLAERVPTVAEQVHLFMISQNSLEAAREVKRRLDEGADFYSLARELNVDEDLKARGGDLGWYPRCGLADNLAQAAFDELEIGQPSSPLVFNDQLVVIIMVAERAAARQIEEETIENLKSSALERWLDTELRHHSIAFHGLKNGFDAETEAWVQWQLYKMTKK